MVRRLRYRWARDHAADANIAPTTSGLREPRRCPSIPRAAPPQMIPRAKEIKTGGLLLVMG
jgi:hypothetical protein